MSTLGQFLLVVVIGVATGILSGMFGVGGAIISTPAIRALGASPLEAVGSTLPSIIPSAISGTVRYAREGLIRWTIFRWTAGVGVVAAVGGALLTEAVPGEGHVLMLFTAMLLAFTSVRLGRPQHGSETITDPDTHPLAHVAPRPERTGPWPCLTVGVAAGALSGLLGVGGGLIMVPAFTTWLRLPLKSALGTSLACVGALAVPSTVTHALLGHIDWSFAIPLSIGVIPGAQIGAHLTIRATERALRVAVASVLGVVATAYFVGELWSIVG